MRDPLPLIILPQNSRSAPPRASALIEALRGLGYSTATALADIVDNSIPARAASVALDFVWTGEASHVSILDDGRGMNDRELDTAMRLGEKNPLEMRETDDLGRFGLGLKTASFSQCRRLTVASIRDDRMDQIYRTAAELYDALGLQRARLRLVGVRVEGLVPRSAVHRQLVLGEREHGWSDADRAVDRASRRFGSQVVQPASLLHR